VFAYLGPSIEHRLDHNAIERRPDQGGRDGGIEVRTEFATLHTFFEYRSDVRTPVGVNPGYGVGVANRCLP